ncbi:MAG: hypothetical protein QOD00_1771 [Blastocatellia bacterium]|jgi:LysM repeat protein|nr:hypothetical protein [Blastocatellia bacterium]
MEPRFAHDFNRVSAATNSVLTLSEPGDRHELEADHVAARVMRDASPTPDNLKASSDVSGMKPTGDFSRVRVHTDARAAEAAESINARAFTLGSDIYFGPGQYAPQTASGRQLLAHELAHVNQQRQASASSVIHRSIKVVKPDAQTPNIPPPYADKTNAQIVESWIDKLCPAGEWWLDSEGMVRSPKQKIFCSLHAPAEAELFGNASQSGTPESCRCLCEMTAPQSKDVSVYVADYFQLENKEINVDEDAGGGITHPPHAGADWMLHGGHKEYRVGLSGSEGKEIKGSGNTTPFEPPNPQKNLPDPPWIIFAHEVCGHARLAPESSLSHAQTAEGNKSTIDMENKIRLEHSTSTENYGTRKGDFYAYDPDNPNGFKKYYGSVYKVSAGETLSKVAQRCGIPAAYVSNNMFRANGAFIANDTEPVKEGELLLISRIYWHEVRSGETLEEIAKMWGSTVSSLKRANPQVGEGDKLKPGQRLLIPLA